ncbi:hypothetical protein H0H92_006465 [Tricholoma furcatifolium]|nr:hypothetical protein H0H92_006465 [Tricholoma furcatifolium]
MPDDRVNGDYSGFDSHMRVSVPGLPQAILSASSSAKPISPSEATLRLADFIGKGKTTVLTGAGVSVDSGIRAYRGNDGRYMNPNYKSVSMRLKRDIVSGYPPVRDAQPNTTHFALAALQHTSVVPHLITQNVDGLHHKALHQKAGHHWGPVRLQRAILELHGTLHDWLSSENPELKEFADEMERTSSQPRTNPDGDVAVEGLGISYSDYIVPNCPSCLAKDRINNIHKPEVIFFGESIPQEIKMQSYQYVENCDKLLVIGTTLATYSAYRLLKHAVELKKTVMMLNVGPSRADGVHGVTKIDMASGMIMREVARTVLGSTAKDDPIVAEMLRSGIYKPPPMDHDE